MTTEEKAKAYDEAIGKAQDVFHTSEVIKITDLFPQLAESEDERIRKVIHKILLAVKKEVFTAQDEIVTRDKALAYLEKQKDLDKMIVVSPEVWDKAINDAYENGKKDGEKQKDPHYTKRNALFDKCVENCDPTVMKRVSDEVDEMLEKEQKPSTPKYRVGDVMRTKQESAEGITDGLPVIVSVDDNYYYCTNEKIPISEQEEYEFPPMNMRQKPEWSDEDWKLLDEVREHIIGVIGDKPDLTPNKIYDGFLDLIDRLKFAKPQLKQEWSKEDKDIIDEAAELALGWGCPNLSAKLKSILSRVKPAEWSEEDEDAINGAIGILLDDNNPTFVFPEHSKLSVGEIVKRLKSLRPQSKVEWSEKEKKMLAVISYKISQHQGNDERSLFTPDEAEFIDGMEDKLKSLRPCWKPSEEQMEALKDAVRLFKETHFEKFHYKIESLYEQLKKL